MKTAVSESSLRSYDALRASGFRGQHAAIVSHMDPGKTYSRRQLAKMAGLETSAIAGRVNELIAAGDVVGVGHIKCPITGRLVEGVRLAEQQLVMPRPGGAQQEIEDGTKR